MELEFPLKRNTELTFEKVNQIFTDMSKHHRYHFSTNNITDQELKLFYGFIVIENTTMKRLSQLSDYFQEQQRISAKRYDEEYSPLEYWKRNKELSREEISRNTKECSTFCPTIICSLIKTFHSKKILDFSTGWGDRLIGTMSYDDKIKEYCGIDPNKSLHSGYKNMIKTFLPKSSHRKYNMIHGCAEDIISQLDTQFDLIFTSPPYFDIENYSNDSNQSIHKFPKYEDWYTHFLLSCLRQSVTKLTSDGILAINIDNTPKHNIVDALIKDMKKIVEIEFLGIIYCGNHMCKTSIYQSILIWQKK